jgi:hypothetical protein
MPGAQGGFRPNGCLFPQVLCMRNVRPHDVADRIFECVQEGAAPRELALGQTRRPGS